jgi:hypothetical protein
MTAGVVADFNMAYYPNEFAGPRHARDLSEKGLSSLEK